MKYRVSRCADSPKKRKLKGCATWGYQIDSHDNNKALLIYEVEENENKGM